MSSYKNIYSVSDITKYIKNMITQDYLLSNLAVRGEVSSVTYHGSGHVYFTLKDAEKNILNCVIYKSDAARGLKFKMEIGQEIVMGGNLSVQGSYGRYQFVAREIGIKGEGDLNAAFLELKQRLEEKGMFAPEYKQKLPRYIHTLGVVTSPTGAVIHDVMDIAKRRNPYLQIILYPAGVQGDAAPPAIIRGIQALEARGVDLIIVGRGGGSKEDLWCFNDEALAQAIFDCRVPIISAVGHETDFSISDYVADRRAATPSEAAELAVADVKGELEKLDKAGRSLDLAMRNAITRDRLRFKELRARLEGLSPQAKVKEDHMRAAAIKDKLEALMDQRLRNEKQRAAGIPGRLGELMDRKLQTDRRRITGMPERLDELMERKLKADRQRIAGMPERFGRLMDLKTEKRKHQFAILLQRFKSRSPLERLGGGYVYATDQEGKALGSIRQLEPGSGIRLLLKDGSASARIESVREEDSFGIKEESGNGG